MCRPASNVTAPSIIATQHCLYKMGSLLTRGRVNNTNVSPLRLVLLLVQGCWAGTVEGHKAHKLGFWTVPETCAGQNKNVTATQDEINVFLELLSVLPSPELPTCSPEHAFSAIVPSWHSLCAAQRTKIRAEVLQYVFCHIWWHRSICHIQFSPLFFVDSYVTIIGNAMYFSTNSLF